MATRSCKTGFPEFFADTKSAESLRRQFIEAPLDAASQSALGSVVELATFLSILPEAFVASQRRELERVVKSGKENDARVAALQASIDRTEALGVMAQHGQVRVQRAVVALATNDRVFHGFVSDTAVTPLKGLTVRLTNTEATRGTVFAATTDDQGYFSIPLGKKADTQQDPARRTAPIDLSQRISDFFAATTTTNPTPTASDNARASQVEILKAEELLYQDPVPIALDEGSVYREYVIAESEPPSASDLRNSAADLSSPPPRPEEDATESATERVSGSTASPSAKNRTRGAKSTRPRNKK